MQNRKKLAAALAVLFTINILLIMLIQNAQGARQEESGHSRSVISYSRTQGWAR